MILRSGSTAELRGPGVKRGFEDSGDDYDLDLDNRNRGVGGHSGRIILLGDGTEVLNDSDDTEMFDHEEEDKYLDSQVAKGQPNLTDGHRESREDTPGPESEHSSSKNTSPGSTLYEPSDTSSVHSLEKDSTATTPTKIPESALPDKIVPQTATLESK